MVIGSGGAQALIVLGAIALGGCGGDEETGAKGSRGQEPKADHTDQRQVATDRTGDVRVIAKDEGPPRRGQLDLDRVELRRERDKLSVRFRTVRPAAAPSALRLVVYRNKGVIDDRVIVEVGEGGRLTATVSPARGAERPISVKRRGRLIVAETGLTPVMEKKTFLWQATMSTKGEIVDRVPNSASDFERFRG